MRRSSETRPGEGPRLGTMSARIAAFFSSRWLALWVAMAHCAMALWLLSDYGPTWDAVLGDYAYGERILESWLHGTPLEIDSRYEPRLVHREPHPDFQFTFAWFQLFPFAATFSAASCHVLHDELGWMAPLAAHHLAIVLGCSLLVWALVRFAQPRFGGAVAVVAVAFLFSSPTFFAHSFNNLKDVPETCLYSFAAWMGFRAMMRGGWATWCAFGGLVACALAQKPNVVFLPLQLLAFAIGASWLRALRIAWSQVLGFACSLATFAATYVACSPAFWTDGWSRFGQHIAAIREVGNTMFAPSLGSEAVVGTVSWHGIEALLTTTPVALLVFAALGCVVPGMAAPLRAFLVLWLLTPILRTLIPGMRTFDGVRHFLEFYPPAAMLAAHGLAWTWRLLRSGLLRGAVVVAAIAPGAIAVWQTHPNGVCWFNSFGGSLAAQQAGGNPDATDFWGNSYWQAIDWLNVHAAPNARVLAPINPPIFECGASVKLRSDLVVCDGLAPLPDGSTLYVTYVTRRNWYGKLVAAVDATPATLVHSIDVQGAPILRIHAVQGERAAELREIWRDEQDTSAAMSRIVGWFGEHPEFKAEFATVLASLSSGQIDAAEQSLRAVLPDEFANDVRVVLQNFR